MCLKTRPQEQPACGKALRETSMAAFRIELLHHSNEHCEQRHDLYAPDLAAAVVQARALFRAISPGKPSLVSFRIMENGLIAYEARKADLGNADEQAPVHAPDRRVLKAGRKPFHRAGALFRVLQLLSYSSVPSDESGYGGGRARSAMAAGRRSCLIDRCHVMPAGKIAVG
jgi:hypothetical protein